LDAGTQKDAPANSGRVRFFPGLTNHHTLVQIIPAFLLAAGLFQIVPHFLKNAPKAPMAIFFSVFFAVNLFSLSILFISVGFPAITNCRPSVR